MLGWLYNLIKIFCAFAYLHFIQKWKLCYSTTEGIELIMFMERVDFFWELKFEFFSKHLKINFNMVYIDLLHLM